MIRSPTLRSGGLVAPTLRQTMLANGVPDQGNPFASINDDFSVGPSDPTARPYPWAWYRPGCVRVGEVVGGRLRIIPVERQGTREPDDPHSWWFGLGPGFRRSGMLLFKTIGPGASPATPRDFSARCRFVVSNEAGTGPPPGGPAIWTFGGLAIHSPVRPPTPGASFLYDHAAGGTDQFTPRGYEAKTNQGDESTYPVVPAFSGSPGDPIACDARIDRIGQIVQIYFRPSGAALSSNVGWVLVLTIDHSNAAIPPRTTAELLPDTLQIAFMVYSNVPGAGPPSVADVMVEVLALEVLPIAA